MEHSFLSNDEDVQFSSNFHPGDPYPEDSVRRGVNLNADVDLGNAIPTFFDGYTDHFGHGFYDVGALADPDAEWGGGFSVAGLPSVFSAPSCDKTPCSPGASVERFSPHSAPAKLPTRYVLTPTTLYLETRAKFAASPSDLMNEVLDFFESGEGLKANVKATDQIHYTIVATVFVNHKMCEVRASLFEEKLHSYSLEFDRLKGDCFSFKDFFALATKALKAKNLLDPTREPLAKPAFAPPSMDFLDDLEDEFMFDCGGEPMIGPLLCAARMKEHPAEQAEAASGLADAVSDKRMGALAAKALCEQIGVVLDIMECKLENAGYQAARLVEALVQHETAAPLLGREDFVAKLTEKIVSDESKLVRAEFKKVADLISKKHGPGLSQEAKDLFARASTVLDKIAGTTSAAPGMAHKVVDHQIQVGAFASPTPALQRSR